jgi:hypothetical protein
VGLAWRLNSSDRLLMGDLAIPLTAIEQIYWLARKRSKKPFVRSPSVKNGMFSIDCLAKDD